ncbi:hypothetical protein MASR2M17_14420 [Aminivibrio sp.]
MDSLEKLRVFEDGLRYFVDVLFGEIPSAGEGDPHGEGGNILIERIVGILRDFSGDEMAEFRREFLGSPPGVSSISLTG